ncbi:MAG TPA: UDP-glucose 4-epimerase GalE [Candidatus Dormibacteraeota bacterium]
MRLLVTGGAGYIGSVCSAVALAAGHQVTVFDNLGHGHRAGVPAGAELVEGDLLDEGALRDTLRPGFDAVLHFAALIVVPESVAQPERYYRNNVVGTLNLVDAMRGSGVRRLVFSSTAAVYGDPETVPIPESAATRPASPYGNSKLAVDRLLADECAAHGLGAVSLRYFNVGGALHGLGEDHRPETHLIPSVLAAAAGRASAVQLYGTDYDTADGTCVRDYVHIEDLAAAHFLALDALQPGRHDVYNLGSGSGFSVREVIETVRRVTGREFAVEERPRRAGDSARLVASSERIQSALGWVPRHGLEDIVRDAWQWMQEHPDGYAD